ncbi:MAG: cyclic nucleotide-binding protein [Ahrensia sp.]|nr:cyclic nucleotide-binding protein [Ahrensia sp.]
MPDYLVACAGFIYIVAFLIINQIVLRCMLLVGSAFYVAYYAVVAGEPLWMAIFTNIGISTANFLGLLILIFSRSRLAIPKEHSDIYPVFSLLPPGDFRTLIRLGRRRVLNEDAVLTRDGAPVDTLYFVLRGEVVAEKRGETFMLPERIFIGEVGYLTRDGASATTRLAKGGEVLEWDVARLRAKAKQSARFNLALDALISKDLAAKVSRAGAPGKGDTAPVSVA